MKTLLETDMDQLLPRLQAYEHAPLDKWIDRNKRKPHRRS
jgi:uncharacterized protein YqgV (UPF0045/DUF77 family)